MTDRSTAATRAKAPEPTGPTSARAALGGWLEGPNLHDGDAGAYRGERLGLPESGPGSLAGQGRRLGALVVDWVLALLIARAFGWHLSSSQGTWGTLAGWLLWAVLLRDLSDGWMILVLLLSFGIGCWAAQRCGDALGVPDHGGINWDEIVAIWLVLWLMPHDFWSQAASVALFRFFDIVKPPPVGLLDRRFKNGFGVMIDDIVAALYALLAGALLVRLGVLS